MISEKPWPPERVLQLLIWLFASMFIGMLIAGWLNSVQTPGPSVRLAGVIVGTLSFHGMALILIHRFLHNLGMTWTQAFGFLSPRLGRAIVLGVLVAFSALPIAWILGQISARILSALHVEPVSQGPVQLLQSATDLPMKLLIGFLAIVVAPCAEEMIFRGVIYPTVKQHGFPKLALWGTSALFATIHGNLVTLLPLTFFAILLTLVYESTDNLLAPILTHSVFNLVNFFWIVAQAVLIPALAR